MSLQGTPPETDLSPARVFNWAVFLTLAIGCSLSLVTQNKARQGEVLAATRTFEREAVVFAKNVQLRIGTALEAVRSIRAFHAASQFVSRSEFQIFTAAELDENRFGIQALEWIPRVAEMDRAAVEASAREDGLVGFRFTEQESQGQMVAVAMRPEYFPVLYVEPVVGNEAALGFDIGSNPERMAALARARDTGQITVTGRITLVQETEDQFGFLIIEPIYMSGSSTGNTAQRRAALSGFALGVLRVSDFVEAAFTPAAMAGYGRRVFLFDTSAPTDKQLLYTTSESVTMQSDVSAANCFDTRFSVGDRDWLLIDCPDMLAHPILRVQSWTILIVGLLLTAMLAIYIHLTARQGAKTELLARVLATSEERYRTLFDNAHDLVHSVDQDGKVLFANRAWLEALDYSASDLPTLNIFDLIAPESKEHCTEVFKRLMMGESEDHVPVTFICSDGRLLATEANLAPQFLNGRVIGSQGIFRDVSERKQIQAELIQSAKMATLGEMSTGVAHELNQPLNVIRMAADSTLECIEEGDFDVAYLRGKLTRISAQTERAAAIIDHMRIFGRKVGEQTQLIDVRNVAREAAGLVGEQLRLGGIKLEIESPEDCRMVRGHAVQLEQILLNLFHNARDAIEANCQEQGQPREIALKIEDMRRDGMVRIVVEDSGGGIPDTIIDRIFEPFFTTKGIGAGTGLGLSISYGIVRDMGGRIEAANHGAGARITITVPAVTEQTTASRSPEAP